MTSSSGETRIGTERLADLIAFKERLCVKWDERTGVPRDQWNPDSPPGRTYSDLLVARELAATRREGCKHPLTHNYPAYVTRCEVCKALLDATAPPNEKGLKELP